MGGGRKRRSSGHDGGRLKFSRSNRSRDRDDRNRNQEGTRSRDRDDRRARSRERNDGGTSRDRARGTRSRDRDEEGIHKEAHDVQIIYNKNRGRRISGDDCTNSIGGGGRNTYHLGPAEGPIFNPSLPRRGTGKGLLGDAPSPPHRQDKGQPTLPDEFSFPHHTRPQPGSINQMQQKGDGNFLQEKGDGNFLQEKGNGNFLQERQVFCPQDQRTYLDAQSHPTTSNSLGQNFNFIEEPSHNMLPEENGHFQQSHNMAPEGEVNFQRTEFQPSHYVPPGVAGRTFQQDMNFLQSSDSENRFLQDRLRVNSFLIAGDQFPVSSLSSNSESDPYGASLKEDVPSSTSQSRRKNNSSPSSEALTKKSGFWDLPSLNPRLSARDSNLKSQIKELKDYILRLENEKKDNLQLQENAVESEKVQQLRDYIMKVELEKQELVNKLNVEKENMEKKKENDMTMISLVRENIEKVAKGQEIQKTKIESEKARLGERGKLVEEERGKLEKAKADLKVSLESGMNFLSSQKEKMETEIRRKREMEFTSKEKSQFIQKIADLEKELKKIKNNKEVEEKRHLASELEELEIRKEMTKKAIEDEMNIEKMESKVEDLNGEAFELKQNLARKSGEIKSLTSDLEKLTGQREELAMRLETISQDHKGELDRVEEEKKCLKKNLDVEYLVFSKKKDEFNETDRLRCVFCPRENLQTISNYMFHIAREHMFDQYKSNDIKEESVKVGLFLKILEEKARKESSDEMQSLQNKLKKTSETSTKEEEVNRKNSEVVSGLNEKVKVLERDIETLLEVEANQKNQMDALVTRNNTLTNQIRGSSNIGEQMRIERQEANKRLNFLSKEVIDLREVRVNLEREVDGLRQKWKVESSEKMGLKNKCRELNMECGNMQRKCKEMEKIRDGLKESMRREQNSSNHEKDLLKKKIRSLEEKTDELVGIKSTVESQLLEIKAENEAIKEFRSDLNAVNDVVCEDMRVENKTLKSKLEAASTDVRRLRTEISTLKNEKEKFNNELCLTRKEVANLKIDFSDAAEQNESLNSRLTEALQKIELIEKDKDKGHEESQNTDDGSFSFGIGLDSILKAPLDIINLQIENIDLEQLDKVGESDNASEDETHAVDLLAERKHLDIEINKKPSREVISDSEEYYSDDDFVVVVKNNTPKQKEIETPGFRLVESKDDDFDYSLLDSTQEEEGDDIIQQDGSNDQVEASMEDLFRGADIEQKGDLVNGSNIEMTFTEEEVYHHETDTEKEDRHRKTDVEEEEHLPGCDCVQCDDCDVLHGFLDGGPCGIREMMRRIREPSEELK